MWGLLLGWWMVVPAEAGLFGSDAPARIPVPAKVFRVEVVDTGGTDLRIDQCTFDGEVFVYGTIGLAQVTVPFGDIATVDFEPGADLDHRIAVVTPAHGDVVRLVVESDKPIYGKTTFGNYKIELKNVRRLEILGEAR